MAGGSGHGRIDVLEPPVVDWSNPNDEEDEELPAPPTPKKGWWQRFKEWHERWKIVKTGKLAVKETAKTLNKGWLSWTGFIMVLITLFLLIVGGIGAQKLYPVYLEWKNPTQSPPPNAVRGAQTEVVKTPDGNAAVDTDGSAAHELAAQGASSKPQTPAGAPAAQAQRPIVGFSQLGLIGMTFQVTDWHRGETRYAFLEAKATRFSAEFVGFTLDLGFKKGDRFWRGKDGDPLYEVASVTPNQKVEFAMLPSTKGVSAVKRLHAYGLQRLPWSMTIGQDTDLGEKRIILAGEADGLVDKPAPIIFNLVD